LILVAATELLLADFISPFFSGLKTDNDTCDSRFDEKNSSYYASYFLLAKSNSLTEYWVPPGVG